MAKKISWGWDMRFRLGWSHMNWPNCNRHIGSQGMVRTRQPGGLCILGCRRDGLIQAPAETGNEVHVDRGAGHPIQEVKGGHHQEDPGRRRNFWHITSHLLGHRFLRPGGIILSTAKDLWMPRKKSHMLPRRMWLLGKRVLAIRGTYQNWLYFKRLCCTTHWGSSAIMLQLLHFPSVPNVPLCKTSRYLWTHSIAWWLDNQYKIHYNI